MAKAGGIGNGETQWQNAAVQIPSLPRDLLRRFASSDPLSVENPKNGEKECEEEEIELSLGLSLNGRFGIDPRAKSQLTRSSSIPEDFINKLKAKQKDSDETACSVPRASPSLVRACSLPVETEEEWRKRKELQSLKRMEAKRKRLEKMRAVKEFLTAAREDGFPEGNTTEEQGTRNYCFAPGCGAAEKGRRRIQNGNYAPVAIGWGGGCRVEARGGKGNVLCSVRSSNDSSHGSTGIEESHRIQGTNKKSETISPTNNLSVPKMEQKQATVWPEIEKSPLTARSIGENMPIVSTKGNGANGKRIEGFLYRYRKGEEVRIVCVCHGSCLSPAEFVKHAGAVDVVNPLKHIVVDPSSFL